MIFLVHEPGHAKIWAINAESEDQARGMYVDVVGSNEDEDGSGSNLNVWPVAVNPGDALPIINTDSLALPGRPAKLPSLKLDVPPPPIP